MRSKTLINGLIILPLISLISCGGGGGQQGTSPTTGWEYNNPENGGFEVKMDYEQPTGPGLVFVQGGNFSMGIAQDDPVLHTYDNLTKRATVSSFYIDETEVRNVDYREYLNWIGRVYRDYPDVRRNALPDTNVWRRKMAFNEPYVKYYFRHPAYNEYPVVGVSWNQAQNYCEWRTDRVNEKRLIEAGVLEMDPEQTGAQSFHTEAYLAGQYEGKVKQNLPAMDPEKEERRAKMSDGIFLPQYRLPTEAEWEYAAKALKGNTYEERVYEKRIYPWDGHNVRNSNRGDLGKMMANFRRGRGDMMGVAGDLNDEASITAPVKSFWPNDFGLYCMAGNVNEWVKDVYRPSTFDNADEFRPYRGNVYKKKVTDEEGRVAPKDSLGRIKYERIDEEDAEGRKNYSKADYRDYEDGDQQSSIHYDDDAAQEQPQLMYKQDAEHGDVNSLINDRSRVYKGGSWMDRAYWLSPGERRFLNQDEAQVDIGFRCAMDRMGSPKGK